MNKGGNHSVGFTRVPLGKAGFTIIETLIVLAVTTALFVSAVLLINGRQAKTEFQTGINNTQQQVQQVINETASGYFPSGTTFNCNGSNGTTPAITSGSNSQGTNDGCIFVGKVIQLSPQGKPSSFLTYPLAGNRRETNGNEVCGVYSSSCGGNGALPVALYKPGVLDFSKQSLLDAGLQVTKTSSSVGVFGAVGFISSFGAYQDTGGASCNGLCSGSQQLRLYVVPSVNINDTQISAVSAINTNGALKPVTQAKICVDNGGKLHGLITIDSQLTVDLTITSATTCGL